MNFLQEKSYFIQRTQDGIFLFLIGARSKEANGSYIQYDGKDHALFFRAPDENIVLDYINPTVHQDLLKSDFIEMMEVDTKSDDILRDYRVPIQKVPQVTVIF